MISINKKIIVNITNLVLSNIISLVISVFSAFITPKILGHEQYGYYKIFSLYVTYVPLLHIGFIDGIMARNAGKSIDKISYEKFRAYTRFIFLIEFILSSLIFISSFFLNVSYYNKEILIYLSLYSLLFNMSTYFQFFSKSIMDFEIIAKITRAQAYFTLMYLIVAYLISRYTNYVIHFSYYLLMMNIAIGISLFLYSIYYKKIIFGKGKSIISEKTNIIVFFKIGFGIMFSYQLTMFMVNADNQFISIFFNINEYAEYAFAYSLAAILITIFNAASSVMLPYMRKYGKNETIEKHSDNMLLICIIVFFVIFAYYPITLIVSYFLPSYTESIQYLKIIFPGVGITCIIQSYLFNNFILIKKMKCFGIISVCNLLADYAIYYLIYSLFNNILFVAYTSVPLLLIWYLSIEVFLNKVIGTKYIKNFVYIFLLTISFVLFNHVYNNIFISFICYGSYYVILTYLCYSNKLKNIFKLK